MTAAVGALDLTTLGSQRQARASRTDARLLPRPGPVWGPYPMRGLPELPSRLALAWWAQRWRAPAVPSDARRLRLLARVHGYQRAIDAMSPPQVAQSLLRVRLRLGRDGFTDILCAQVLAHVAAAVQRRLGLKLYDTQIAAAWTLLGNRLIEMPTGEGKTLVAFLTAASAALAGVPVHVLTSNDYLAERDADSLRPLYEDLGLRVGCVRSEDDAAARRRAYACNVTYATAREVAFDHLRDRLGATEAQRCEAGAGGAPSQAAHQTPVLRGLCMAVLDEADNVLIDEAITPMILSQQVQADDEARRVRLALYLARQLQPHEHIEELMPNQWTLTDAGRAWLDERAPALAGEWQIRRFREEQVTLALAALHSFRRDVDYVVHEDEVQIVDAHTGRRAQGRAWSRGLHQLIGLKEGLAPAPSTRTMMQMTYQQFFPRYLRLCGLSGTLSEARRELMAVYGLPVVPIPTARKSQRLDQGTRVMADASSKWVAVVERVQDTHQSGRAVLVGTGSVADSQHLSALLTARGIAHRVLNASQDAHEADIVALAGERGAVTVATQMAGRGTDIPVSDEQDALGGLHVINACLHQARRIDRQLDGRCARRGQRGSHQRIISLDEELFVRELPEWLRGLLAHMLGAPAAAAGGVVRPVVRRVVRFVASRVARCLQSVMESRAERARWVLMQQDEHLARSLAWTGRHRWD